MKTLSLVGQQFGRLTVVRRVENNKFNKKMWLCDCSCGSSKAVLDAKLKSGETKSCGCLRLDVVKSIHVTHGASYTGLYNRYKTMIQRCHNPANPSYPRYGGRGITVCDRWRESYANFLADMGEPPAGHSLDRIDGTKGYSPQNCRWATPKQQSENSSKPRIISFNGNSMNVSEWAAELGIDVASLVERLKKWPIEDALSCGKSHRFARRRI